MKKTLSKTSIQAIAFSLLFLFSGIGASLLINPAAAAPNSAAAPAAATPLTAQQANWEYTDGNQFAQDFNPQTQINSSNAQNLGISWLYPLPSTPTDLASAASASLGSGLGVDISPLIVNGTIYAITEFGQVIALNAANGDVVWSDLLPIQANSTVGQGTGVLQLHFHQGVQTFTASSMFFHSTPTYWISAPNHVIYAINALNGSYETVGTATDGGFAYYTGVNAGIDGNSPTSTYAGAATTASNIVFDLQRGILLTGMFVPSASSAARCFVKGWNMEVSPPALMWTSYCTPPQPNSNIPLNPNWDAQQIANMTGASIFYPGPTYDNGGTIPGSAVVNLKTLPAAQLNSTLYNDWGYAGQSAFCLAADGGQSTGSTGSGWGGSWLLDSKTGIGYVNTNNRGPYAGSCNPGPDLWADAIMAINDTTGQWIWAFQTSAHDNWDWDCSWYQGLGNETIGGVQTEVLFKTCKDGYVYELNAKTGSMIWAWTPPRTILPRCQYCQLQNPLNSTQMTNSFASPNNANFISNPSELAGFESTASYNPVTNMIYVTSHNIPTEVTYVPLNSSNYATNSGIGLIGGFLSLPDNATTEAVNASNGEMVWSHNIPNIGFRGGMMSSGGVVFAPLVSGDILMLNGMTGAVIKDDFLGAPMAVVPAIGATTSGQEEVIVSVGDASFFGNAVPGDLVALALPASSSVSASVSTTTVGKTVTSTVSGGSGSTVTTTVGSGGATVTTTVGSGGATVTTTVGSGGATVTTTVASGGATITAISTVVSTTSTSGGGVSSATLYGVAAIAVIFIIATGYLAMRGRKPTS